MCCNVWYNLGAATAALGGFAPLTGALAFVPLLSSVKMSVFVCVCVSVWVGRCA